MSRNLARFDEEEVVRLGFLSNQMVARGHFSALHVADQPPGGLPRHNVLQIAGQGALGQIGCIDGAQLVFAPLGRSVEVGGEAKNVRLFVQPAVVELLA